MDLYRHAPGDDPDDHKQLSAFLKASVEAGRWQTIRGWVTGWLVVAGAPLWTMVAWPRLVGRGARAFLLASWVVLMALELLAVGMELKWSRRLRPFRVSVPEEAETPRKEE